jgi:hypothetical protein
MSPLTTNGTKFEVRIQDPMKHSEKTKSQRKAQEGHLEEVKPQQPTQGTKVAKSWKEKEKLNTKAKPPDQHST